MFQSKKRLKQIEELKETLNKEKQEILEIENQLSKSIPKISISNLYLVLEHGVVRIGRLNVKSTTDYRGKIQHYSVMTDIFNNDIIFEKYRKVDYEVFISSLLLEEKHYIYLQPLYKVWEDILLYDDEKIPLYTLQQIYYELNELDVDDVLLKKHK